MNFNEWMIAEVEAVFDLSESERMQLEDILESDPVEDALDALNDEDFNVVDEWMTGCNGIVEYEDGKFVVYPLGDLPIEFDTLDELVEDARVTVNEWHKEGFYPYEM